MACRTVALLPRSAQKVAWLAWTSREQGRVRHAGPADDDDLPAPAAGGWGEFTAPGAFQAPQFGGWAQPSGGSPLSDSGEWGAFEASSPQEQPAASASVQQPPAAPAAPREADDGWGDFSGANAPLPADLFSAPAANGAADAPIAQSPADAGARPAPSTVRCCLCDNRSRASRSSAVQVATRSARAHLHLRRGPPRRGGSHWICFSRRAP